MIKLTNALGEELDLSQFSHLGLKVEGLGFALDNSYYSDSVYSIHTKSERRAENFSIQVLFGADDRKAYVAYQGFANFLNHQPLTMTYQVDGVDAYQRDCRFLGLTKGERVEGLYLEENFSLQFLGPWYQWKEGSLAEYVDHEGDGKAYEFTYPYIYEDNFANSRYFFLLDNDSRYFGLRSSSPLEIVITAGNEPIVNPSWSIRQEDSVFQSDGYFLTLNPGDQLVVSSNPQSQKAMLYIAGEAPRNVYQQQDVTKTNFVTAPIGQSTLFFENCKGATITYRLKQEAVLV